MFIKDKLLGFGGGEFKSDFGKDFIRLDFDKDALPYWKAIYIHNGLLFRVSVYSDYVCGVGEENFQGRGANPNLKQSIVEGKITYEYER